ncbi:zona pellucida sperm-binding protein 3 [Poecilia formosa]|uniref:Zona pellucida sperm-binding protein 3 n=1 Tax=Poecilia formosa TaxID=48698 RepID=A0A087XQ34_POEFO|nr:PREDICTED: zona pellucida sperm-binding protein 3-like [Poecilia formosa]XP_016525637.1 PREDICTED: zona pellucida sperm-binding protein 3-like [Poecilia formosa]
MKTKWHLFIILFICALSLGSICCAADSHKSLFTTRRKVSKVIKPSTTEDRGAIQRISRLKPPLSQLRSVHSYTLVTPSLFPGEPEAWIKADSAYAPDVSVTCSPSDFVVRVKPAFYGLGAEAQELTLGRDCRSNGISRPHGDLLFTYPLTACDGVRELPDDYLVYKYVLHYKPSPKRFPSRAHQIDVNIECHYQRDHAVYQLAVQPTWQTVVLRKKLKGRPMEFQINLMDGSWRTPAKSQVYLLGQTVNIQVSAPHLPAGLKLYTNSCYAAPSSGSKSSLKYTLIDNFGCMLDSKHEPGSSQFVSRTDKTLRFSLRTFQFTANPDTKVTIFCKLFVTSGEPGPAQKSCTYQDGRWQALTGEDSICECCDSTCVTSKPRRALEGFAVSKPLLISDQPHTSENWYQEMIPSADNRGREDEGKLHYKDLNDNQKLWEDAAGEKHEKANDKWLEESETIRGETVEPELEELADSKGVLAHKWSEPKLSDLNEFGKGESRYEEAFKASEDEITEVKDLLLPRVHWKEMFTDVIREGKLKPPNPEEGKTKKHACKGDENRRMMQGRNDDGEMEEQEETWYFTWT